MSMSEIKAAKRMDKNDKIVKCSFPPNVSGRVREMSCLVDRTNYGTASILSATWKKVWNVSLASNCKDGRAWFCAGERGVCRSKSLRQRWFTGGCLGHCKGIIKALRA
jgi:hypothetical protein